METEEIEVQPVPEPTPTIILTNASLYYLSKTAKWANFLAIVGFILAGIFLIVALSFGAIMSALANLSPMSRQFPAGAATGISIFYILLDVLYFFFPFYLYQFSSKLKKAIFFSDSEMLGSAFEKLKSYFTLWGIVTIIAICFYALMLIIIVIAGIGAASMLHGASGTNSL